jgi:hypothetical protein
VFAVLVLFLVVLAVLVVIAMTRPTDLVSDRYYDDGLRYQDRIDQIRRARGLGEGVQILAGSAGVTITFPRAFRQGEIAGDVLFYRPSERARDFRAPVVLDTANAMTVAAARLGTGVWRVQVLWSAAGTDFYNEQPVILQ